MFVGGWLWLVLVLLALAYERSWDNGFVVLGDFLVVTNSDIPFLLAVGALRWGFFAFLTFGVVMHT